MNSQDCAVFWIDDTESLHQVPPLRDIVEGVRPLVNGPVYKIGKETGLTIGLYDGMEGRTHVRVKWRSLTKRFTKPGDSGSLYFYFMPDSNEAVPLALHFGSNSDSELSKGVSVRTVRVRSQDCTDNTHYVPVLVHGDLY